MPTIQQNDVLRLLAKIRLRRSDIAPHNYESLKSAVIERELRDEIRILQDIFKREDYLDAFKSQCRRRALQNTNSCLNFLQLPNGQCNTLYWQIATILFTPDTMGERLATLMPEVTTILTMDASIKDPSKRPSSGNITITFKEKPLSMFAEPAALDKLKRLVVVGHRLLDVDDIATFDFPLHQTYYDALLLVFPDIANRLYNHNAELKALHERLLLVKERGETPYRVISTFRDRLIEGGQSQTGQPYATLDAQKAFTDFMGYLASLPPTKRANLLGIGRERKLSDIVSHLLAENCVEIAAANLSSILEDPSNEAILNQLPGLSREELLRVRNVYYHARPLPTAGIVKTQTLPTNYLEIILSSLRIRSTSVFLDIIRSVPVSMYTALMQQATINSVSLKEVQRGLRRQEQKETFKQAVLVTREKFGAFQLISAFSTARAMGPLFFNQLLFNLNPHELTREINFIRQLIEEVPRERRLAFIEKKSTAEDSNMPFLHWVVYRYGESSTQILPAILELLPDQDRVVALSRKDRRGHTLGQIRPGYVLPRGIDFSSYAACCRGAALGLALGLVTVLIEALIAALVASIAVAINPAFFLPGLSIGLIIGGLVGIAITVLGIYRAFKAASSERATAATDLAQQFDGMFEPEPELGIGVEPLPDEALPALAV